MKAALLVGINYQGTSNQLAGCINDVENAKKWLLTQGYQEENITLLTDDTHIKPTKSNIIKALVHLFVSDADQLYFHYSGHGTSVRDRNGDEADGLDECLCPLDFMTCGFIVDDELKHLLGLLSSKKRLFAVLDCCHSGTAMDLAYGVYKRFGGFGGFRLILENHNSETKAEVVMLSGCKDSQTSADAYEEGESQGALTYAFLKVMEKKVTYEGLIQGVRKILKNRRYAQVPNLSSGKRIDLKDQVKI